MVTRKLTGKEIAHLNTIPDTVDRQIGYQTWVVDYLAQKRSVIADLFPRSGKTYLSRLAFERFRKVSSAPIVVICPKKVIAQEWKEVCGHISNLHIYVVNSYINTFAQNPLEGIGMCVYDEVHNYANASSKLYSTIFDITPAQFRLGLSGSLESKHLKFLEGKGFLHRFEIPLRTGRLLDLVADYVTWNCPVQFTPEEKAQYAVIQEEYNVLLSLFEVYFPEHTTSIMACCAAGSGLVKYDGMIQSGN